MSDHFLIGYSTDLEGCTGVALHSFRQKGKLPDFFYFFLCAGVSSVVSDHLIGQSTDLERYSGGALHYFAQKEKFLGFSYFFFCV